MLFGDVGHCCSHTPQPVQPSSITLICPDSSTIAAEPIGQTSMQVVQSSPSRRTQYSVRHSAVPMSISLRGTNDSAPLGQFCIQCRPSHNTHAISEGST